MRLISLFPLLLLLAACGSGPGPRAVPVEEGAGSKPQGLLGIPPSSVPAQAGAAAGSGPDPAVAALLAEADREGASGRWGSAAATVERALNLQPKNAYLWYRLAVLRLQQGNWQQAYVLANKSNSLIRGDPALKAGNWRVIATAQRKLGNTAAAAQAEEEIRKLVNRE